MVKKIAEGKIAIYLYINRINELIVLEDNLEGFWEAVDHCGIYWRANRVSPKNNLLICHKGINNEVKWHVYDPELECTFVV